MIILLCVCAGPMCRPRMISVGAKLVLVQLYNQLAYIVLNLVNRVAAMLV